MLWPSARVAAARVTVAGVSSGSWGYKPLSASELVYYLLCSSCTPPSILSMTRTLQLLLHQSMPLPATIALVGLEKPLLDSEALLDGTAVQVMIGAQQRGKSRIHVAVAEQCFCQPAYQGLDLNP